MTRPEWKQIGITLLACLLTGAIVLLIVRYNQKKIAVVDAVKLFNAYKMKQEMEAKAGGRLRFLAHQADSIKQELTVKSKTKGVPEQELQRLYQSYNTARSGLEQEYEESNQAINEQVWKRLNPVIDEYGKEKGLRLIVGANGMGSVLYYDAYYDHTEELIEYVNQKYETGN